MGVLKTSGWKRVPQVEHFTCSPSTFPTGNSGMKNSVNQRRICCRTYARSAPQREQKNAPVDTVLARALKPQMRIMGRTVLLDVVSCRGASETVGVTDDAQAVREFTNELAGALANVAADALVGVYLHGSAVLGDWIAPASDVDVLVVVGDGVSSIVADRMAEVLRADRECPGAGLELSVVEAGAASAPTAPWPFVFHAATTHNDRKIVWGTPRRGDADLILHYAIARDHGWAAYGPEPRLAVGAIPEGVVANQLAQELRWAVEHAGASYAILNACRALRYREERTLCSKTDGGNWARARRVQPALVQAALDDRRLGVSSPIAEVVAEWVLAVAADLS